MIPADVKTCQVINTKINKRSDGCILQIFIKSTFKTEIQCKKVAKYFPFNFGWYSINFDIFC